MNIEYYKDLTQILYSKIKLLEDEIKDLTQIINEIKQILYKTDFPNNSEDDETGITGYFF